jgi:hypothetical protein
MTTPSLSLSMWPKVTRFPSALWGALRQEAVLIGIVGVFVLAVTIIGAVYQRPVFVGFKEFLQGVSAVVIIFPLITAVLARVRDIRAGVPASREAYRNALRVAVRDRLNAPAIARLAVVVVGMAVMMSAFTAYKQMLYLLHPFTWDVQFAELDRILHGGRDAYAWLDPVLHSEFALMLADKFYFAIWPMTLAAVLVWQAWQPPSEQRRRFLIVYAISWILLGAVVATLLASGGPTYYTELTGQASPYAGHEAYLRSVSPPDGLVAIGIQDWLWYAYTTQTPFPGAGISAMPSMHVAIAELYAILGRRTSRGWGVLGTLFSLLTLVCSVYLGPHYAIDGYLAIALVHVLWRLAGRIPLLQSEKNAVESPVIR